MNWSEKTYKKNKAITRLEDRLSTLKVLVAHRHIIPCGTDLI